MGNLKLYISLRSYQDSRLCRGRETEHVILECEALVRCRLWTMGYPGSDLENIRRDHVVVVRGFIHGIRVLGDDAAADMRDELFSLDIAC